MQKNKQIVKNKEKKQKGITLVALVVTIVVLLILAGITIVYVFGDNGIFKLAQEAKDKINEAIDNESKQMNEISDWLNDYLKDEEKIISVLGNMVALTSKGRIVSLETLEGESISVNRWSEVVIEEEIGKIEGVKKIVQSKDNEYAYFITNQGKLYELYNGWFREEEINNVEDVWTSNISASGNSIIAKTTNGDLYAWGYNGSGQLGIGSTTQTGAPTKIEGLLDIEDIYFFSNYSTIARTTNGDLYAWGLNSSGQLGIGSTESRVTTPTKIEGVSNVEMVYCGWNNAIAKTTNGDLYAWGYNYYGQLGIGNTNTVRTPTKIEGISNVEKVYMFDYSDITIATIANGDLYAWGYNYNGELGVGSTEQKVTAPAKVEGIHNVKEMFEQIITTANGEVYLFPTRRIEEISNVDDSHYYDGYYLVKTTNGELYVWGSNDNGELGIGTNEEVDSPVCLTKLENVALYGKQIEKIYTNIRGYDYLISRDGKCYVKKMVDNGPQ